MFKNNRVRLAMHFLLALEACAFSKELHELSVLDLKREWKSILNQTIYKYQTFYIDEPLDSVLFLSCDATYPVQWNFTGHLFPTNRVIFTTPEITKNNSLLVYKINIRFNFPFWDKSNWAVSVRIACEKVGQPEIEKSVLVLVRRKSSFLMMFSNEILLGPKEQTVLDSKLIPCPTKDPTVIPNLYKINHEGKEQIVHEAHIKYNFYQGFVSNDTFSGVFVCRSGNSSVMVNASVSSVAKNFEIFPKEDFIQVFSENAIHFKCKSKLGKRVHLHLDNVGENFTVAYSRKSDSASVKMSKDFTPGYTVDNATRLKATGKCFVQEGGKQVVVKEWSYEFLRTPELYLNNFKRSIDCVSNTKTASVRVFRCVNKMECEFLAKFPATRIPLPDAGSYDIQTHFFSKDVTFCHPKRTRYGVLCVRLLYPYTSGLAQCNVDGLFKQWEFFTSLDNRKYTNWRDAPKKELIRVIEEKLSNEVTHFFCSAVSYLFSDSLYFEIEFLNGTRNTVQHNGNTVNVSDQFIREREQVEGLTFVATLDIILPKDTEAIHCVANWWNRTGELRTSRKYSSPQDHATIYKVLGITSIILIIGLVFMLLLFIRRYKAAQQSLRNLTNEEVDQFFHGKPELLSRTGESNAETVDLLPFPEEYIIPLADLSFDSGTNFLGFGNFSYVVRGTITSKGITVAVKISKPSANIDFFKSLLSEVKVMVYIGKHENVLSLTGVCTENIRSRCIHIATEVCEVGNLKNFLLKARPSFTNIINANQEIDVSLLAENTSDLSQQQQLTILDLIRFSCEIAKGMEYLAYKSIIHGDLAARNVLLTSEKMVKISDFGLSKKLYENSNYVKKSSTPLPWRWMAIECLTTLTFSTNSDVWAYGVTLFEIFSLGDTPYPNEQWDAAFLARLEDGMRMGRPKYCTKEIYHLLSECWENEPELRPSFSTLRSFFEKLSGRYCLPGSTTRKGGDDLTVSLQNNISEKAVYCTTNGMNAFLGMENESCNGKETLPQPQYVELCEYGTTRKAEHVAL